MAKRNNPLKLLFVILLLIFLPFCTPKKKIEVTKQIIEFDSKIKEADILFKKGNYFCLKEAFKIYQDLLSMPYDKEITREKLIKTAILLALRENELVILDEIYLEKASKLINEFPSLSNFSKFLEIVKITSKKAKGSAKKSFEDSSSIDNYFEWINKNVEQLNTQLKEKSESEDFFAYLYISFNSDFSYFIKKKDDLSRFLKIFPDSYLIQFKMALYPKINQKRLEELVQKEPRFYEAYYFLGEIALMLGNIITAEKNFLKTYEQIPKSVSIIMSLTKIYFAHEELDKCLEFNDKALQLAPEYRDALLGKAVCLSYLGRNKEAIEVLNKLLQFGKYLMGESYYWLAWNQNELEKYEEAWENIEYAKNYLSGYSKVYLLSGIIAYEKGNLEEAEKDLKEALKFDSSNCEAFFYLGKIYSQREDWSNSGMYFEKAAICYKMVENTIEKKIKEIENYSLSEERKNKYILRKKIQLRKTCLIKATSFYNAAAGYFNTRLKEKALSLAQKAALHNTFNEKAVELINKIKN